MLHYKSNTHLFSSVSNRFENMLHTRIVQRITVLHNVCHKDGFFVQFDALRARATFHLFHIFHPSLLPELCPCPNKEKGLSLQMLHKFFPTSDRKHETPLYPEQPWKAAVSCWVLQFQWKSHHVPSAGFRVGGNRPIICHKFTDLQNPTAPPYWLF